MTKYEYKVLTESDHRTLEYTLNSYGSAGWKLVNVVWNNDESFLITTLISYCFRHPLFSASREKMALNSGIVLQSPSNAR